MSQRRSEQFIFLDFEPAGLTAVCDGRGCERQANYRAMLGAFTRYFCESCLTGVLLGQAVSQIGPTKMPHAIDPKQGGYMNPGGEF